MELLSDIFAPVQLLAWVAALLYIISYQQQSAQKTIILWAPADLLMLMHFYFMGVPLFMVTAFGGMLRSIIAVRYPQKYLIAYFAVYLPLLFTALWYWGTEFKDYVAIFGTFCFCISTLLKNHFLWHRIFAFVHQISWIIAFIMLGSYGGMALVFSMFVSNVIGTGRYLWDNK